MNNKLHIIKRWWFNLIWLSKKVSNLSNQHMIEQFDLIMIKLHEDYIKQLFELEMLGETFTFEKRWIYISDKVGALEYVNIVRNEKTLHIIMNLWFLIQPYVIHV